MNYLLDTNICVLLIRQKSPRVLAETYELSDYRYRHYLPLPLLNYSMESRKAAGHLGNQHALDQFILPLTIIPFDEQDAVALWAKVVHTSKRRDYR